MKPYCLIFLILAPLSVINAQNILPARVVSQAAAVYADRGPDALFTNQAGLGYNDELSVNASAIQRYFSEGILELHLGTAFSIDDYMGAGVYARRFGDDIYSETSAGLAVGRQLFDNFSLGIGLEVYQLRIENYGNQVQFNSQVGFQADITKNVRLGSHLFLPLHEEEELSWSNQAVINLDLAVDIDDHLILKSGIRKITDLDIGVKVALNYTPIDVLEINIGMLTLPVQYTGGCGIRLFEDIQAFIMGQYQQDLGWSSGLNLCYAPNSQ